MRNYKYLMGWVGGKRLLRKKIAELIPKDIEGYIEPFGGGGWVMFYKENWAKLEVYNDLDNRLVNLFNIVKYHSEELSRQMSLMLSSRKQFEQMLELNPITDIQKAARFLYVINCSFGARGKSFGTTISTKSRSRQGVINRIFAISKRLDNVLIENRPATDLIAKYDKPAHFFYCDPPYTTGAGYDIVSTKDFDHEGLFKILANIKGRFLLSYDDSQYIRNLYKNFDIIEVSRHKGINNITVKDREFKELLIKNY